MTTINLLAINLGVVFLLTTALWAVSVAVKDSSIVDIFWGSGFVVIGWVSFAVGLFFETVGDLQLTRFIADPANKGTVMDRGLWRYTRHPNYFGDFSVWWGLYLIALAAGAWWTIIGPIIMSVLLIRVSGAGLLEKSIGKRRAGYDEYVARTSGFFPRPPKRS